MRKFISGLVVLFAVLFVVGCFMTIGGAVSMFRPPEARLSESSILLLSLDDVIQDGEKFLNQLRKYRKEKDVKGILVQINSPGGAVGPSQEIYMELKRTREEFKKPVVVSCLGVMASGAYYAAVAADKIVVTPGCMAGSIGVIMQFANLEKLFDWAKVEQYAIKTGKFKDTGALYRGMTTEERQLLQELVDDVLVQFKSAVVEGRKVRADELDKVADGRVFTGTMAIKLGLADQEGTLDDAKKVIGEMTGLGDDPKIFKPRAWDKDNWRMFLFDEDESEAISSVKALAEKTLALKWRGQPLLIWPAAIGL